MEAFELTYRNGVSVYNDALGRMIVSGASLSFSVEKTLFCGQCFRWTKSGDNEFFGIVYGIPLKIVQACPQKVVIENTAGIIEPELAARLAGYFDLETDYNKLEEELSKKDSVLEQTISVAKGIRILRQELFETVISFIISQNNNIPRIKKCIELLCRNYGKKLLYGDELYAFPSAESLAAADAAELQKSCRVGYRADFIVRTAKLFAENGELFKSLYELPEKEQTEQLLEFPGVGPKVANCILLFAGLSKSAFPVDVWVERLMGELYGITGKSRTELEKYGRAYFGENAGIAQQYLFYYIRSREGLHG